MQTRESISPLAASRSKILIAIFVLGGALLLIGLFVVRFIVPASSTLSRVRQVSQTEIIHPVHGQMLITACKEFVIEGGYHRYNCDISLFDPETEQFVRLVHRDGDGPRTEVTWSPDATMFSYYNGYGFVGRHRTTIYRADGTELFHLEAYDSGFWSADASYFAAWTCDPPNIEGGHVSNLTTVFDAASGRAVCSYGGSMACTPLSRSPSAPPDCLPADRAPTEFDSDRYQATIEGDGLRVIDVQTGTTKFYVIEGLSIMAIAWAPER